MRSTFPLLLFMSVHHLFFIFPLATLDASQADIYIYFLSQPSNVPFPLVFFIFPLTHCLIHTLRNIHATLGVMVMQPLQRSRWHPLATSRLFGTRRDVATFSSIFRCKRAEARFCTARLFMPKPAVAVLIHFDAREGTDFTGL